MKVLAYLNPFRLLHRWTVEKMESDIATDFAWLKSMSDDEIRGEFERVFLQGKTDWRLVSNQDYARRLGYEMALRFWRQKLEAQI